MRAKFFPFFFLLLLHIFRVRHPVKYVEDAEIDRLVERERPIRLYIRLEINTGVWQSIAGETLPPETYVCRLCVHLFLFRTIFFWGGGGSFYCVNSFLFFLFEIIFLFVSYVCRFCAIMWQRRAPTFFFVDNLTVRIRPLLPASVSPRDFNKELTHGNHVPSQRPKAQPAGIMPT